jgi:hypothetical protein
MQARFCAFACDRRVVSLIGYCLLACIAMRIYLQKNNWDNFFKFSDFCTQWPAALSSDEKCDKRFPIEIDTADYVSSGPSIRNPKARVVTLRVRDFLKNKNHYSALYKNTFCTWLQNLIHVCCRKYENFKLQDKIA